MPATLSRKPFLLNLFPQEKSMLEYISKQTKKNKTEALKSMIHSNYYSIKKKNNKPLSITHIGFSSNELASNTLFERDDIYEDRLSMYQ
jgi:hypothetical protein